MGFQNEEDYLDNLLKSITENKDSVSSEELLSTDSKMKIPDTFETSMQEEKEDDSVYQNMKFDENDINPMAAMFENNMAQAWEDVTVGDVLGESAGTAFEKPSEQDNAFEADNALEQEKNETSSEDDMVDDYIRKVLSTPDEEVPETVSDEEGEEEPTEYIDITNSDSSFDNDLIGKLDGIINTVESTIQEETALAQEESGKSQEQIPDESTVDFSNIEVDDELKELLGVENQEELGNMESQLEGETLSEEDLKKLDEMVSSAEEVNEPVIEEEYSDGGEDDLGSLAELFEQAADVGIHVNEVDAGKSTEGENADLDEIPSLDPKESGNVRGGDKKKSKEGFLTRLLGMFRKKKNEAPDEGASENQQVLDELFDENGELIGDKKKVKKKQLFSKNKKKTDTGAVEAPVEEIQELTDSAMDLEDIPEIPVKEKKKKEKKKKEPKDKKSKEKKPKKPKQPKEKKEKVPVSPSELITIKPVAIIIMLLVIAGVTGYTYFFILSFSYNQALDEATYYLVDKKYTFAYEAIAGVEAKNEEDMALKEQICTIMYVQKQYNSYERYIKMNMPFEAIDSLIKGIKEYDTYYDKAVEIGVSADLDSVKALIVNTLQQEYGISESMARSYGAITDYEQYKYILESYGGITE